MGRWGRRHVGTEQFFTAFFPGARPPVVRDGLLAYEQSELITHAWIDPADLAGLPDRLEPPSLPGLLPEFRSWA